ncbi:polymorphic toxin-type HINT domain-containing protein [uncultured Jatrophihabitans sp.]|uniref:polymorphic toxin-type HINT domain-containing protein n=1 Tax=uncultured Jatrophihabitans sp. TaxID=1610747 RepID=UPI0035CB873D
MAGTQVLLADGTAKAIEDIKVGDEVVAADPETGATHPKPVVETYVHDDVETWLVETSTGTVRSTAEHPFWVDGRGWTPVRKLQPDGKLVDADGVRVELVAVTPTGETATVHNFHVAHLHDYHVRAGTQWVLVHNMCNTGLSESAGQGSRLAEASSAAQRAADDPTAIFIKNKHLSTAGGNGAKFASNDISEVQTWVSQGLRSEGAVFAPNNLDDTFRVVSDMDRVVGTKGQTRIRAIVTDDGRVINAFPVNVA